MSKREAIEKGNNSKKHAPNFKHDEIIFLLHEIKKRKNTLFGMLSPSLTFHMKTKAWLAVREQLVVAGYPPRTKEQLKKKWEDSATSTKAKYARKRKTGGGAIDWNIIDELVTDILGKDNPSLTSIPAGIDSGDKRMDRPQITVDNSDEDDRGRQSTSTYRLRSSTSPVPSNINPTSRVIAEVTYLQPRTQALPLRPLGRDPGERWSRVSQNLGDRNCHKGGEAIFQLLREANTLRESFH